MKLELETNPSAFPFIDNEFVADASSENNSAEVKPLLQSGIKAAREGNRAEAKQMLRRVTEIEPKNENAWMWLASISEYPEELLGYLENVLSVNPNNTRAVEWKNSTNALLAENFVQRGIDASKEGQKEFARQSFRQAVVLDEENETAWLWLASVSDSAEEKNSFLRRVLNINPENENALLMLKSVKNQNVESLFLKAVAQAVSNKQEDAKVTLANVLRESPGMEDAWILKSYLSDSFSEKIACYEKILEINADSPLANVNWTALLEMMARVESDDLPENNEDGVENADHAESEKIYELNLSDEMPNIEPPKVESYFSEENELLEYTARQSSSMPELSQEAAYFEEPEIAPEAIETQEYSADYLTLPEKSADDAPPATNFYAAANEDENSNYTRPLPSQIEELSDPPVQPEVENTDHSEEVLDLFENSSDYSFNTKVEDEPTVLETPGEPVSYYEIDDVFAPPLPKTDYSQQFENSNDYSPSLEQVGQSYDEPLKTAESEKFAAPHNQMPDAENRKIQENWEVQENDEKDYFKTSAETTACPFCKAENETQDFVCNSCHTMLTLSDLEMLLAHRETDKTILRQAVEKMQAESEIRHFDVEEFKTLAIGHINLKHLRLGLAYLQDALQLNPNDVVLSSQVNALAIRLAEIEQQESIHSSMPKNRRILVVDDSATVRKLISSKLEKSGHEVVCAIDGIEALEKINEAVPDLVLLDINMPRMDGYQVCKMIRSNDLTKDVPVVMISGKDGFFDKVRGRMAGTTGYITKPFGPETLMKTIENYIVNE